MNNSSKLGTGANNLMRKSGNNQTATSASSGTGQNKQIAALIVGLVIIAILWVLGNYIYNYYTANQKSKVIKSAILTTPHNGQSEFDIGSAELANSGYSNEYALSFWVYIDDYSYRQGLPKFIMRRGNIKTGVNPEIYLDPGVNTLHVNVSMMGNGSLMQGSGPEVVGLASGATSGATSTTASGTATSTTASGTTTSTAPIATAKFADIPNNKVDVPTDFNADSVAAPGLIADPIAILGKLNNNSAHIPDVYDNSYFSLVSGNEVGSISQSGVGNMSHNPELNVVLEQFSPTSANESDKACECTDDKDSMKASAAERAAFEEKAGKCMVTTFPLQKWVHVVISQYNQVLDIYVDGKLSSSCVLPGFPDIVQDDLVISPEDGFSGKITKVVYLNSSVSANDVYSMYSDGPDHYDTLLSRVPNWAWGVLALIVLAVIIYSL